MGHAGAWQYLNGRSYTRLDTHWNTFGIHETRLANYAANSTRTDARPLSSAQAG